MADEIPAHRFLDDFLDSDPTDEAVLDTLRFLGRTVRRLSVDAHTLTKFLIERRGISKDDPIPTDIFNAMKGISDADDHA